MTLMISSILGRSLELPLIRRLLAVLLWGDGGFPSAAAAVVFDWHGFQPASHRKVLVGRVPRGHNPVQAFVEGASSIPGGLSLGQP